MRGAAIAARLSAACLLAACASAPPVEEGAPILWPDPPDAPRVAYVRSIARPDDLGIRKGFVQRLSDLLFGAREARLVRPMAVVESGGAIFVADPGVMGVHRFEPASGRYTVLHGEGDLPLPSPVGLARGEGGDVLVADSALARVFVIHPGAPSASAVPLSAKLIQPTGIAFDPVSGRLFVVDTAKHRVLAFTRDGALALSFGGRGTAPGEFNFPTLMWRSREGRLFVTDALNFRIQCFDANGKFVSQFGQVGDGAGDLPRQKGVATDRAGHIYIADAVLHAIQVFDGTGAFLLSIGGLGSERGEFRLPTGLYIDDADTIYVADSYNQRVQVLRYVGGAP